MEQERAELVAEPQRAVRRLTERLDVEIGAGQEPPLTNRRIHRNRAVVVELAVGDDRKVNAAIGVAERDERPDVNLSAAALSSSGSPARCDRRGARSRQNCSARRIRCRTSRGSRRSRPAAPRTRPEPAAVVERRHAAVGGRDELAGRRAGREGVGRKRREPLECLRLSRRQRHQREHRRQCDGSGSVCLHEVPPESGPGRPAC